MVDTWRWHTVLGNPKPFIHSNHLKWVDQRGLCIVVCITYGIIDVFLLACIGAWYRLAKYIMIHEWGWSTRGPFSLDVLCMYYVCILTSPEQRAWRHGDTWITYGSHMDHIIHNYTWRYMYFFRGDTGPNSRGIQTIPVKELYNTHASPRGPA